MIQQLQHPAILTPRKILTEHDSTGVMTSLVMVFELMGPSLREAVFRKDRPLPLHLVRGFMADLLGALAFLHSRGIVRR